MHHRYMVTRTEGLSQVSVDKTSLRRQTVLALYRRERGRQMTRLHPLIPTGGCFLLHTSSAVKIYLLEPQEWRFDRAKV